MFRAWLLINSQGLGDDDSEDDDVDEEGAEDGGDADCPSPPPAAAAKVSKASKAVRPSTATLHRAEERLLAAAVDASLQPPDAPPMLASGKVHAATAPCLVPLS